jgi:uncharacterized membrane protein
MPSMSEEEIYQIARKRVEEKKGFYTHLAVYVLVNVLLIIIWALTGAGFPWFIFPLCGWGIGILFHGLGVFVLNKESGWERREIEKEAERLRKSGK